MASSHNGVIETTTGNLKRCGYCDFENDGQLDVATETYMTNVPHPPCILGGDGLTQVHQWYGGVWALVDQP